MATTPMPAEILCCRCKKTFPVKALMSLSSGEKIPLLVVLIEITSIEEALTNATCQVCLEKNGPSDRGLHNVLFGLGCIDAPTTSTRLVLPTRGRASADPKVDLRALASVGKAPKCPSMAGVRVTMPEMPRGKFRRPVPAREPSLNDEPRLPKALMKQTPREPEPEIEHLHHTMADLVKNREALKQVAQAARVAAGERITLILDTLRIIKEDASKMDVEDRVASLVESINQAVRLDPDQRGKKKIYEILCTSEAELSGLRMIYWMLLHGSHRSIVKGCELEEVEENPFPDGRRPRHFDKEGEGRQAALRPVIVVRPKSALPVPNKPLGEPEGPSPKIVYPEGGRYGKDFIVNGSRRVTPKGNTWAFVKMDFLIWAADHPEAVVPYTNDPVDGVAPRVEIPLIDLLCSHLESYVAPELDHSITPVVDGSFVSSPGDQPHAEV